MQNATLPVVAGKNWTPNPNPDPQDHVPEHVAIEIFTKTNVISRTLYFWSQHDVHNIIQAMLHNDVIIKPRPPSEETDLLITSSLMKIAEDGREVPHPPEHFSGEHSTSSCEAVRGSSAETSREPETSSNASSSLEIIPMPMPSVPSGLLTPDLTNSSNEGNNDATNAEAVEAQQASIASDDQAQASLPQAKETQGKGGDEGDHADN